MTTATLEAPATLREQREAAHAEYVRLVREAAGAPNADEFRVDAAHLTTTLAAAGKTMAQFEASATRGRIRRVALADLESIRISEREHRKLETAFANVSNQYAALLTRQASERLGFEKQLQTLENDRIAASRSLIGRQAQTHRDLDATFDRAALPPRHAELQAEQHAVTQALPGAEGDFNHARRVVADVTKGGGLDGLRQEIARLAFRIGNLPEGSKDAGQLHQQHADAQKLIERYEATRERWDTLRAREPAIAQEISELFAAVRLSPEAFRID